MIERELTRQVRHMATKMPVISITGPRQSGKTTLARQAFPKHTYVNLEDPDTFADALYDPKHFLTRHKKGVIIDEAQLLPSLFSYIQTISDESGKAGEYIITGSQNFLLSAKISQSLAGRVFVTHLLPLSIAELKKTKYAQEDPFEYILNGFYPRMYDKKIKPELFYPSYIQTYAERDVRQITEVTNLHTFQKFMRLAAGRIGQLINYSNIANEMGVDQKTIKSWFGILEASFIVYLLPPHHNNFTKRLVKTPKLYFYDTGLACSLLGIRKKEELANHWAKGALFENMMVIDIIKNYYNNAQNPPVYFWRDHTGNEVDCLLDTGDVIKSVEIKSAVTVHPNFFKGLLYYRLLSNQPINQSYLLYGGLTNALRSQAKVLSWKNTRELMK